jgi:hypothetical protein
VVVRGGYYFADPFWYGYPWYGYGGWFPYQYPFGGYPYPYPYGYRYADPDSAVRLEVTPKDAEVFVDGYYAGIVDDFDGVFQRLRVPPGQHEITLYREGDRTVHQTVYLTTDSTFKLRYNMEKLGAGDVAEPRPAPKEPPADAGAPPPNPPGPPQPPRRGAPVGRRQPPPPPNAGNPRGGETSTYGTLAIRVQPANATVTIDGERWEGPQGQDRLLVELSEGTHRVQIQREGFEAFAGEVTIRRGETTPLNVSLRTR